MATSRHVNFPRRFPNRPKQAQDFQSRVRLGRGCLNGLADNMIPALGVSNITWHWRFHQHQLPIDYSKKPYFRSK